MNRKQRIVANTNDYQTSLVDSLKDQAEAQAYLNVALDEFEQDNDAESFLLALRNVAEAQGGLGTLAKRTKLDRAHLYRMLSNTGNPRLLTLDSILRALGFKLAIEAA